MPKRRQLLFQAEPTPEELVQDLTDSLGNSSANAGFIPPPPEPPETDDLRKRRPQ